MPTLGAPCESACNADPGIRTLDLTLRFLLLGPLMPPTNHTVPYRFSPSVGRYLWRGLQVYFTFLFLLPRIGSMHLRGFVRHGTVLTLVLLNEIAVEDIISTSSLVPINLSESPVVFFPTS